MTFDKANTSEQSSGTVGIKQSTSNNSFDCLDEIGLLLEGSHPTEEVRLSWPLSSGRSATVALSAINEEPGAVQSGHYLWPSAKMLANYLVSKENEGVVSHDSISTVLELGAGCALASLVALQIWEPSLQCLVVTDHDPSVVERARNNYESTLNAIYDESSEDDLNACINTYGAIPVVFKPLKWGVDDNVDNIREQISEHTNSHQDRVDVILATDVIYSIDNVEPLFYSVERLLLKKGRFLLAQSFAFDKETEELIDSVCKQKNFQRTTLVEDQGDGHQIQEFRYQ